VTKVRTGEFTKDIVDIEMAAHGGTVIEIRKRDGKWAPVLDGKMNRRLHVGTEMMITGPAAGHDRLKTAADLSGTKVSARSTTAPAA
jgi:secreted PhoX family phosphatase